MQNANIARENCLVTSSFTGRSGAGEGSVKWRGVAAWTWRPVVLFSHPAASKKRKSSSLSSKSRAMPISTAHRVAWRAIIIMCEAMGTVKREKCMCQRSSAAKITSVSYWHNKLKCVADGEIMRASRVMRQSICFVAGSAPERSIIKIFLHRILKCDIGVAMPCIICIYACQCRGYCRLR